MLRVFITLFNLQGTRRSPRRKLFYFTTSQKLCQVLFSTFSKLFSTWFASRTWDSFDSLTYLSEFVKLFFSIFSKSFLTLSSRQPRYPCAPRLPELFRPGSLERLLNIPDSSALVNTFFRVFSDFFSEARKPLEFP